MSTLIHDAQNYLKDIQEVFIFISEDKDGNEAVCMIPSPVGNLPLFTADPRKIDSMMSLAHHLNRETDKKIKLISYKQRVDHGFI